MFVTICVYQDFWADLREPTITTKRRGEMSQDAEDNSSGAGDRQDQSTTGVSQAVPTTLALERAYRDHFVALTRWLRGRFGDGPPEPDDVAQAAFAKLSSLKSLDHIDNLRAFIFTIASNMAVSGIRSESRAKTHLAQEVQISGLEIENMTPERVYLAREELKELENVLESLSDRQKEIVIRSRVYGQTYAQIRAEKGWSLGTIAADMKASMLALAKAKEETGGS